MNDSAAEYAFALYAMRQGSTTAERVKAIIDEYLRLNPWAKRTDLHVTIKESVTERARTIVRPATPAEIAVLEEGSQ